MITKYTWEDLKFAAATVYGEARGESFAGKVGVAHTILNRASVLGGIKKACLQSYAYSCWLERDVNYLACVALTFPRPAFVFDISHPMHDCLYAVMCAMHGEFLATMTCTHYFDKSIPAPSWADPKKYVCTIGRINFYALPFP